MRRIALHLIALSVVVLFTSPAHAEWVRISEFGGVVTTVTPSEMGIENARLMTGWYPQRGDLLQMTFEKRDTLDETALAQGIKFLAPFESGKQLIYSYGGILYSYYIEPDISGAISTYGIDTCTTTASSANVYYNGAEIGASRWLNMVLSDISPGRRTSINIGGTEYITRMFLSDTLVVMLEDQAATATDTMYWYVGFSGNSDAPLYYFIHGDTTTIIDGANRTSYDGVDVGELKWPIYSDSGDYDSIGTDYDNLGDSLCVYGDFEFSTNPADDNYYIGGYFLWADHTDSAHGIPFFIAAVIDSGQADEHILLIGDSSAYKPNDDGDSVYTAHFDNGSKRYLVYAHGLGNYDTTANYRIGYVRVHNIDTVHVRGDGTYQFVATIINTPPFYTAPDWMFDERAFDGAIYRIRCSGYFAKDVESYSVRVLETFGLDSVHVTYWGRGTCGYSQWSSTYLLDFNRFPAVPFETTTKQAELQYDICIPSPHRDRAWYAKGRKIAYSDLNDWYDVAGGGVVTFQKDVTALSSFGNEMVAHLGGNEIQLWTGYAEGDFYKVPAPVGVSAMNQGSLAHSDRDNADYFPHPLGLWKYTSGSVSEVPVAAKEIFTDSVNWEASEQLVGAIYDDKYWFGYPQKPNTTNNRLVVFDLETSDATFIGRIHPGSFYVRTDPEVGQQLWIGDADSAVIWLANSGVNEVPMSSEMRSGWFVGDDRWQRKLVREYTVGYEAKRGDTLMVDFYTGSEDAVWADTIVVTTGAGQTFGNTTTESTNEEITPLQIYGSVYTPLTSGFLDSCRFYLDWTGLEGAEACSVKVAAYTYNNGSPVLVDSCYMLVFSGGEDDGEKTFTFSTTNTQITAGTKYVLFMRATEDDFTLALKKDNTTGTMLTETAMYPNQSITGSWVPYMHTPSPFYLVETSDELQSYVYYSERVVQQHHAVVPRAVQGKVWSYGLRSPSKGMRVLDIAVNWVPRGRERTQ